STATPTWRRSTCSRKLAATRRSRCTSPSPSTHGRGSRAPRRPSESAGRPSRRSTPGWSSAAPRPGPCATATPTRPRSWWSSATRSSSPARRRLVPALLRFGSMRRTLFSEEHALYRDTVRRFLEREVVPHQERWNAAGSVDREAWRKAGEAGLLCPWLPDDYGGPGGDFLHSVVVMEELARIYESGFAMPLHSDIVVPYIHAYGSPQHKQRWLPGCGSGEVVTAIAMTEPGT